MKENAKLIWKDNLYSRLKKESITVGYTLKFLFKNKIIFYKYMK